MEQTKPKIDIVKMEQRIRKLCEKDWNDVDIAADVGLDVKHVRDLRVLMGFHRSIVKDLRTHWRNVQYLKDNKKFVINSFSLKSIQDKLGLSIDREYRWQVGDVENMKFVIRLKEV